jgi:hypothetical protein
MQCLLQLLCRLFARDIFSSQSRSVVERRLYDRSADRPISYLTGKTIVVKTYAVSGSFIESLVATRFQFMFSAYIKTESADTLICIVIT